MSKRTLILVALLAVFTLSIVGTVALVSTGTFAAPQQTSLTAPEDLFTIAGDEPSCPPSVPVPCSGG